MSRKILPEGYMLPKEAEVVIEDYLSSIHDIANGMALRQNFDFRDRINFYSDAIKEIQRCLDRASELISFSVEGDSDDN